MGISKTKMGLLFSAASLSVALILLLLPVLNQLHFCTDTDCETGKIAFALMQSCHQDCRGCTQTNVSHCDSEGSSSHCLFSAFIQDKSILKSTHALALLWNVESTVIHLRSTPLVFDAAFATAPRAPPFSFW